MGIPSLSGFIALLALCVPTTANTQSASAVGDWHGFMKSGGVKIELVLHIAAQDGGGLKATVDDYTKDAAGIIVDSIHVTESKIDYTIDTVGGFDGDLSSDGQTIKGVWTEGGEKNHLTFTKMREPAPTLIDLGGDWIGSALIDGEPAEISLHIDTVHYATMAVAIDAQGSNLNVQNAPTHSVSFHDGVFSFNSNRLKCQFNGTATPSGSTINGTWKQDGKSTPLTLSRRSGVTA